MEQHVKIDLAAQGWCVPCGPALLSLRLALAQLGDPAADHVNIVETRPSRREARMGLPVDSQRLIVTTVDTRWRCSGWVVLKMLSSYTPQLTKMHLLCRYSQKGGASAKGHFRRKYLFARPKYTADKIHKILEVPNAVLACAATFVCASCFTAQKQRAARMGRRAAAERLQPRCCRSPPEVANRSRRTSFPDCFRCDSGEALFYSVSVRTYSRHPNFSLFAECVQASRKRCKPLKKHTFLKNRR